MLTKKILLAASGMFLCVSASQSAGLIAPDNTLRNDLAWLSDRGVINVSLSTWPLSQEEIESVLSQAKPVTDTEKNVISRVEQRVSSLKSNLRVTGYTSTDKPGLPQGFGSTHASDHALSVAAGPAMNSGT